MSKNFRKYLSKVPPAYGVFFFALCGLALYVGAHLLSLEQIQAEVDMSERYDARRPRPSKRDETRFITADLESPMARMAGRLREASGLALVIGLTRVNEAVKKQPAPASVDNLIDLATAQNLLPPGVTIPDALNRKSGVLAGQHATLYLRYRVNPFGVEVVSIGHTKTDGPAILIRLPNDDADFKQQPASMKNKENPGAALYVSDSLDAVTIPPPFSTPATLLTAGWQPDKFRALDLPQDRINALNEWLRQAANK